MEPVYSLFALLVNNTLSAAVGFHQNNQKKSGELDVDQLADLRATNGVHRVLCDIEDLRQ